MTDEATTFAGTSSYGLIDGKGTLARFRGPFQLSMDANNNMLLADTNNQAIRKIYSDGTVSTVAGTGFKGMQDGQALNATFRNCRSVISDPSGIIYVTDDDNNCIRQVNHSYVSTFAGICSNTTTGSKNGYNSLATFYSPSSLVRTTDGALYAADRRLIRKIYQGANTILSSTLIIVYLFFLFHLCRKCFNLCGFSEWLP